MVKRWDKRDYIVPSDPGWPKQWALVRSVKYVILKLRKMCFIPALLVYMYIGILLGILACVPNTEYCISITFSDAYNFYQMSFECKDEEFAG